LGKINFYVWLDVLKVVGKRLIESCWKSAITGSGMTFGYSCDERQIGTPDSRLSKARHISISCQTVKPGTFIALVGVAPINRESGAYKGTRRIRGGRAQIRMVMFMGICSVIRFSKAHINAWWPQENQKK
jgi:hypothetical protein